LSHRSTAGLPVVALPTDMKRRLISLLTLATLAGCGETARLPSQADIGPHPTLVEPVHTVIPTAHVAIARPWLPGEAPSAPPGLQVQALATGLQHPRWLHVLPNGDVLVADDVGNTVWRVSPAVR
jgi:glucose/arabinose dehydrogenase